MADSPAAVATRKRPGGRTNNQLRPMACETGVLVNAHGSCRLTHHNSEVLCSIMGPLELKHNKEHPYKATLQVSWRPKGQSHQTQASMRNKEFESLLHGVLESIVVSDTMPRSGIQVTIQVIEDDGSVLSTALHAAILALMDAGIAMRTLVCACTTAIVTTDNLDNKGSAGKCILLDPTKSEEQLCQGHAFFAFDSNDTLGVMASLTGGQLGEEEFWACLNSARAACQSIAAFMRISMTKKVEMSLMQQQQQNSGSKSREQMFVKPK